VDTYGIEPLVFLRHRVPLDIWPNHSWLIVIIANEGGRRLRQPCGPGSSPQPLHQEDEGAGEHEVQGQGQHDSGDHGAAELVAETHMKRPILSPTIEA
jgi:hypothetical protein